MNKEFSEHEFGPLRKEQKEAIIANAIEFSRELGLKDLEINAVRSLGDTASRDADFESAITCYERAAAIATDAGDTNFLLIVWESLATALMLKGRALGAPCDFLQQLKIANTRLEIFKDAEKVCEEAMRTLETLGQSHEDLRGSFGRISEAIHALKKYDMALFIFSDADLQIDDDFDSTLRFLDQAARSARSLGDLELEFGACWRKAVLLKLAEKTEFAATVLKDLFERAEELSFDAESLRRLRADIDDMLG